MSGAMTTKLIDFLKEIKPNYGDAGTRDCDVTVKRNMIDAAIAFLSAQQTEAPRGFEVELPSKIEQQFNEWGGKPKEDTTPFNASVLRLAFLLNRTNRGLIDYQAALHFAHELYSRIAAPAQQTEAPVNVPSKTAAMHSAVRKVLQHHGLTQHGDGVIEADLIYAVLNAAPAPVQTEAQQTVFDRVILPEAQQSEKDVELPAVMLTRATSGMCEVSLEVGGKWVTVIRDNGDIISHIVEPRGISRAIAKEKAKS